MHHFASMEEKLNFSVMPKNYIMYVMNKKEMPHYIGHRRRLRKKLMENGLNGLHEYEIIELLLTFSIPYKDVKPIAKELLEKFGSLSKIFDATPEELTKTKYIKNNSIELIKFIKEVSILYHMQKAQNAPISQTREELIEYCIQNIGSKKDEEFRVISLNTDLCMISDDLVSLGTIDRSAVYPRKVMEIAVKRKAFAIILVHNHPDGHPEPSEEDITVTKALEIPAQILNIKIYDHLIISQGNYFSFWENKIL